MPASTIWPATTFFSITKPDIGAATVKVLVSLRVFSSSAICASGTSKYFSLFSADSRKDAALGSLVAFLKLSASKNSDWAL